MDCEQLSVVFVLVLLAISVLLLPLYQWLRRGWRLKRHDILDGLNSEARLAYFQRFDTARANVSAVDAHKLFDDIYTEWYGRRHYVMPILILTVAATIATTLGILSALESAGYLTATPLFDITLTGTSAVAGAYMWVVDDFIGRSRRLDMAPSNIHWGTLRITIAVPMGFAFASVAAENVGPFVAFALGAFPIGTLTALLRRIAQKQLDTGPTAEESNDDIVKLQGINKVVVERLANEDITTVLQLAYCDPVRLTMRSNLSFNFVMDCMSQALAWLYLTDHLEKLRPMGLRGAVEIGYLMDLIDAPSSDDPQEQAEQAGAQKALPEIAKALGQEEACLLVCFKQIAADPFTGFLRKVWA